MTSRVTHHVKAVIKRPDMDKAQYVYVGRATTDDQGRIAICLDALPRDMPNWTGWLNLFSVDAPRPQWKGNAPKEEYDDDIPF